MKRWFFILLALAVLTVAAPSALAQSGAAETEWALVDGIAATVDGDPVFLSEVMMEKDFGLLKEAGQNGGLPGLLDPYINRLLILKELEDVGGFRLDQGQEEEAFGDYLRNLGGEDVFAEKREKWGVSGEEIAGRFRRALLASLYAESRIRFLVKVLPGDIEKAYGEDPEKWGGRTVIEVWEEIRDELVQESFAQEKERWLKSLRDRYQLEIFPLEGDANL
ncbi:MAG: hypothetical protein JXR72_08470 [Proteobacteria bacterium]|nr:hypothetical protein [Pseudomonadota bacterium]